MDEKLDQQALAQLTEEERQALAEDSEDEIVEHADTADDPEELRRDRAPLLDTHVPADLPQRLAALVPARHERHRLMARLGRGLVVVSKY
ncbi:hypothetical protein AMST5_01297 [freshwater sediment metagenome]|uniref:Uncharacterized protein n=1 Tax=freshwater sediment metagenome TaxID=556182 RepID=A0AA48LYB2_9ZZZZ